MRGGFAAATLTACAEDSTDAAASSTSTTRTVLRAGVLRAGVLRAAVVLVTVLLAAVLRGAFLTTTTPSCWAFRMASSVFGLVTWTPGLDDLYFVLARFDLRDLMAWNHG